MCGIAAIVSADRERLAKVLSMMEAQIDRGPDHHGNWLGKGVAMAHTRLSLLDLSERGDQPMHRGGLVLSYNGEIYNHMALRKQHLKGVDLDSTSDTATLLALIGKYGVRRTLPLLRGMWAFALWNDADETLSVATDPFGIKPAYITHDDDEFAVASSSAALLGLRPQWRIDPQAQARFFRLGGTDCVWQDMERIPGGTLITYHRSIDSVTRERWYRPVFNPNAEEELDGLITEALDLVQVADLPIGLFLSGGVDSSCAAAHCKKGSIAFHLQSDEQEHAELVAKKFGLNLHVVPADASLIADAHHDIVARTGEPTMGGYIPWMVSQHAAEQVKAAISANGADELFFGYDWIARQPGQMAAQDARLMRDASAYTARFGVATWEHAPLKGSDWPFDAHARWRMLQLYIGQDLNPTLDAASMCHSLEMRVPFLDHKLVEAALSLPFRVLGNKLALRARLIKAGIPKQTVDHPKLGFSLQASGAAHKTAVDGALAFMQQRHGLKINPSASGRDRSYLGACALAWHHWETYWTNEGLLKS